MTEFNNDFDEVEILLEDERLTDTGDHWVAKRAGEEFRELVLRGAPADQAIIRASQRYYRVLVESQIEKEMYWGDPTPEWLTLGEQIPSDVVNSWQAMIEVGSLPTEVKERLLKELVEYRRTQAREWLDEGF